MMNNTQYYLNRGELPNCPQIPTRYTNYLDKNNCLSEFVTQTDKEIARQNLGISDIINQLNYKIDTKVIERGNIAWDLTPTEDHHDSVLSSHDLYNTFLRYALRTDLENRILSIWSQTVLKIEETLNAIEDELNELNTNLRAYVDELRCEFNSFKLSIEQRFTEFTEDIVNQFNELESQTNTKVQQLEDFVNQKTEELQTSVDEQLQEQANRMLLLETRINSNIQELNNNVNTTVRELTTTVNNKIRELNNSVKTKLDNFQELKYKPLEARIKSMELQLKTFLKTASGGTAITDVFGDSEEIGVNLKTLTDAINKIWSKLEDMTGESMKGINMVVTPEYFIGENGCNVHINANTAYSTGIFEHVEFQINGVVVAQADNVDLLVFDTEITETSIIKCIAKITGIEYTLLKVITHYSSFFLGSGTSYNDILNLDHVIPITNGMRGAYDLDINDGDHIYVIVGESLANGFIRADMNGVEIIFNEETVTIDDNVYKVFISLNTYLAGTYNIDING